MDTSELLLELYGRIPPLVAAAVEGLDADQLAFSPEPGANTIAWLTWHLARVQDHHVAELLDTEQIWTVEPNWAARVGIDPDPDNTGYGHDRADMEAIRPDGPEALVGYLDAVDRRTTTMLRDLSDDELDRVVDRNWDPPVTLGVRLVSIADDSLQHAGQAAYVRGLLDR
ncbi:MAG: mycothiol transferase [Microthrixaceae bacterium]